MRKKPDDKYKPVRIMDFSAWDIMFHESIGVTLSRDMELNVEMEEGKISDESMILYKGSMPASLDCFEIWESCKEYPDDQHMEPYTYSYNSSLKCSDAVINVKFTSEISLEVYNKCKKTAEGVKRKNNILKKWIDAVDGNQKIYEEYSKAAEEDKDKTAIHESLLSMRKLFVSFIIDKQRFSGKNNLLSIRKHLYKNGFDVDTGNGVRHYVVYKRSASKAKTGSCLFIWDKIYEHMMDWTWMGLWSKLNKNEEYDLTSMKAYEALVSSSVSGMAEIKPHQILLIESVLSPEINANRLIMVKNTDGQVELVSPEDYEDLKGTGFEAHNKIWDGQALVDKSVFEAAGYKGDNRHGMMLLRNKFFKACAFNTNIQKFYRDNKIEKVYDMFGRELNARDIRMIVTPDSLKFVDKFADIFFKEKNGESAKHQAYKHWLENIPSGFGIVKEEKASHIGNGKYHEVSYQVLSTLPLDKEGMRKIIEEDINYADLLKNDEAVILKHMEEIGHSVTKNLFFSKLYKYFSDFEQTFECRDIMRKERYRYLDRMKLGRIKIRGDFYVLCSMPLEMLMYSKDRDPGKITSLLGPGESYIKGYGRGKVTIFRYPHISSGGVCSLTNIDESRASEIEKYFNLDNKDGSNIIIISPWESNIMVRLGGADFDSDSVLLAEDETIKRAAEDLIDNEKFGFLNPSLDGLPVVEIDEELKGSPNLYKYESEDLSELDNKISGTGRTIGELSNDAQLFNAYFWEEYFKENHDEEYLKQTYRCSLMLSALNELEIDSAKHATELNIKDEREAVKEEQYNGKPILRKTEDKNYENPYYLYLNKKKKSGKKPSGIALRAGNKFWNCPVDHIAEIIDEQPRKINNSRKERISLSVFLKSISSDECEKKPTANQLNELYETIRVTVYCLELLTDYKGDSETEENREWIQSECLDILKNRKISAATAFSLLKRGYEKRKSDSKNGKKGEYKYPDVTNNSKVRNRYLGFVLSLIDKMMDEGLLKPDICRKRLVKGKPAPGEKGLVLWGEMYHYKIDHPGYIKPEK